MFASKCIPGIRPFTQYAVTCAKRFASRIKLQSDFGAPVPAQRPPATLRNTIYLTEPQTKRGVFWRYLGAARAQLPLIGCAVAGVCLYSVSTLAIPSMFGLLIDHACHGELPIDVSFKLIGWFSLAALGNFTRLYFVGIAGQRIIASLRRSLYSSIMHQPTSFFDDAANRTGALVQRLSMDCTVMGNSLTETITNGSKNLLQTIGSVGVMLYFSPLLTSVTVCMVPPVALFAGFYGRYIRKLQHNTQDALAEMATVAEERLSHIRTVKAFGTIAEEEKWFGQKVNHAYELGTEMLTWSSVYMAALQGVGYTAMYGVIWAGSMLVASSSLTSGTLFSFILYTIYCGIGLLGLTNLVTELNKGYGASLRLFDLLDKAQAMAVAESSITQIIPHIKQWEVKVNDLDFAYPTRPEVSIYHSLNLTIAPNKCTCVVGSSGSGKSSLALLLLKLYDPVRGGITIDGINVAEIQTKWLHEHIGYVGQDPVLFGGTVAQNIAYGVAGRNWDDPIDQWLMSSIVESSMRANAHDFVASLPDGYNTFVGENGRSLSGGQKQRIAIARALIRHPKLIILDEATSALDSESEKVVHEAIFNLIDSAHYSEKGINENNNSLNKDINNNNKHTINDSDSSNDDDKAESENTNKCDKLSKKATKQNARQCQTVLLFAHKLSMIRKADHIIVLHNGGIEVQGSFNDVCRNEVFCQLVGITSPSSEPTQCLTERKDTNIDSKAANMKN